MPRILVTNDDGVHSEGIKALAAALAPFGDITTVAPIQEASAIGHALTLRRPLRIDTIGPNVFAVDGAHRLRQPGDHARAQGQARPDRVGDQQGVESR